MAWWIGNSSAGGRSCMVNIAHRDLVQAAAIEKMPPHRRGGNVITASWTASNFTDALLRAQFATEAMR